MNAAQVYTIAIIQKKSIGYGNLMDRIGVLIQKLTIIQDSHFILKMRRRVALPMVSMQIGTRLGHQKLQIATGLPIIAIQQIWLCVRKKSLLMTGNGLIVMDRIQIGLKDTWWQRRRNILIQMVQKVSKKSPLHQNGLQIKREFLRTIVRYSPSLFLSAF